MKPEFKIKACPADFRSMTKAKFNPAQQWYVYIEARDESGRWRQVRRLKKDTNRIHNLEERKRYLSDLLTATRDEIDAGWNPITGEFVEIPEGDIENYDLQRALHFVLEKMSLDPKTRKSYAKAVDELAAAGQRLNTGRIRPRELKRRQLMLMFDEFQKHTGASDKTYNKYLGFIKSMFSELVRWEFIESSVAHALNNKKVSGKIPHKQPENHQKASIRDYIEIQHPNFWTFCLAIYHTGARPVELLAIRVRDVNMKDRIIEFAPDITKPEKMKRLPITRELYGRLQSLQLESCNADHFLFGSPYPAGEGYRGNGYHKKASFCPSPTKTSRDTATKLWKKLVKDDLGINAGLYGLKHRGGNDKLRAGIDIDTISSLYGHADRRTTEIYAFEINEHRFNDIAERSPDFI